jgi:hypothetical protein
MIMILTCLLAVILVAGKAPLAFSPTTGDKVLDSRLDAVNAYATRDKEAFLSGLGSAYHVDRSTLQSMLDEGMTPADVYMTLRVARITGQTPEQVGKAYLSNPGKGWGVISKSMGIKPGSDGFKSLKSGAEALTGKDKASAGSTAKGKQSGTDKGKGSDASGGSGHGKGGSGKGNAGNGKGKT